MQEDDPKKAPEDIEAEDDLILGEDEFDVVDFDEEDDLGDESWDEFDDAAEPAAPPPQKRQSFLGKYFNIIVIGVGVVIGGFILLGMLMPDAPRSPSAPSAPETAADAGWTDAELPPMPVPISASPGDISGVAEAPEPAAEESGVLTPMPPFPAQSNETEMAELDVPEVPAVPVAQSETGPDIIFELEKNAAAETETPETAGMNEKDLARLSAVEDGLKDLERELGVKIDSMTAALAGLEEKLDGMVREQKKTTAEPVRAEPAMKAPEPAPKPALKKEAAPPEPPPAGGTGWQLRAAQPGKAIVAPRGSNEFKTIEVGDMLEGIGKISSIQVENGRWVVRGSRGTVSQ